MTLLRAPRSVGPTIAALALLLAGCREEPVRTYRTSKEPPPPPMADAHAGHNHAAGDAGGGDQPSRDTLPPGHPPIGAGSMPAPAGAPAAAPAAVADSIVWAAPDHWAAKPLGAMRRGSFAVHNAAGEADCSVFVFPAATNPLLANINRWRGQIGLAPLTEAQLPAESATLESAGLTFTTIEIVGEPAGGSATRVLGAILYRGDEAWFFKLSGPDAVVAAERTAFADFLRSVRPARP